MNKAPKKILAIALAAMLALSLCLPAFATDILSSLPTYKLYTVTNGGGDIVRIKEAYYPGELVTLKAVPYDGFAFYTWESDDVTFITLESDTTTFIMPAKEVVVGAIFGIKQTGEAQTVAVNFDTMGGSEIEPVNVEIGGTVSAPANPVKQGYKFDGWYSDATCTLPFDFATQIYASTFVYAKWAPVQTEPVQAPSNNFTDVKSGDWFYDSVMYVKNGGLMNGTTATTFAPASNLTRAMLVTVLYRLEGSPEAAKAPFEDVKAGSYYEKAVAWAQANGIVNGYTAKKFGPDDNITREQIATIMHRYASFKKYDVSAGESTNILSYEDSASVSEYAISAVQYAVGSGLMKGKTETTLNPKDNATRAEIAAILNRFIEANKAQ